MAPQFELDSKVFFKREDHKLLETLNPNFFGGKLVQRKEHNGKLVKFAGHILLKNGLASRIGYSHVVCVHGKPDGWF